MIVVDKIKMDYQIRSYECDHNGTLRLIALMNILQDAADTHASNLGVGIEYCVEHGFAWVGSNYHVKINRMPKWHEKITITSWPSAEKKLGAIRDFRVTDEKGDAIIIASSQWILINFATKRPVVLRDNLPVYKVLEERSLETEFTRIPELEREDLKTGFKVRYDDIDVNNHVNNAVYTLWASESVDPEFRFKHSPVELEIAFKKEGLYGEDIEVVTQADGMTSLHSVKAKTDGRELAKVKILWK